MILNFFFKEQEQAVFSTTFRYDVIYVFHVFWTSLKLRTVRLQEQEYRNVGEGEEIEVCL